MPKVSFFSEDLSNLLQAAGRTELTNLNSTLCKSQSLKKLLLDCTLGELQLCINFHSFNLTSFTLFSFKSVFCLLARKRKSATQSSAAPGCGMVPGEAAGGEEGGLFPRPTAGHGGAPHAEQSLAGKLGYTRNTKHCVGDHVGELL